MPEVSVEGENAFRNHWFKKLFYRKDGAKLTVVPRRAKAFAGALSAIGYLIYLLQSPPEIQISVKSSLPLPKEPLEVQKSEIGESKIITPKTGHAPEHRRPSRPKNLYSGPELVGRPKLPIPSSTITKGKLLSGASNGALHAQLTEPVSFNGETLLQAGLILVGNGTSSEERLFIRFHQVIFKDGSVQAIEAQAFDPEDRTAGLKGSLLGNRALKLAGSIGLNFVGGVSDGLQEVQTHDGTSFRTSTMKNALLNGASTAAIEESRDQMSQLRNQLPIIQVKAGSEILISFDPSLPN